MMLGKAWLWQACKYVTKQMSMKLHKSSPQELAMTKTILSWK